MNHLDKQDNIDELRKRLYSRGESFNQLERHDISDVTVDVSRNWEVPTQEEISQPPRRYRWYILLGSFVVLLVTAAITGFYMFSGGNQISSENISINISAQTTLGGGERMSAQIGITNQNAVAIESATLIVSYPENSQTVTEPVKSLFEERIWIDRLEPGEARNIPIDAIVYGEEGDEKQLRAQLEYRIVDSDSMFYKDASPHNFRITSSPVTLQVRSVRQVSAGQEVETEIIVTSNTNTEYTNLLVTAQYPNGFTYKNAEPAPAYNQNVWRIERLKPEESHKIVIKGTVTGLANESLRLSVGVGPSQPDNQFIAGATLTDSYTEFIIERPFIDVSIDVNGKRQNPVVLDAGNSADVEIEVTNTLDESVYDMVVEVVPSGSALGNAEIRSNNGFYNSNTRTIRFESANVPAFAQLRAGESEALKVTIEPKSGVSTASFFLTVNIYGRRVGESSAQEQLFGTAELEVRYASSIGLGYAVKHVEGPVPPQVQDETSYQVTLTANAGSNDITNGLMTTSLPIYVNWDNNYQAAGTVNYNPVTRLLTWEVGNVSGGQSKDFRFAVSVLPSQSQVGTKPILVNTQEFSAKDRFTGTELTAISQGFTLEIGANGDVEDNSGTVQDN